MEIVILDGYTLNPSDLSWESFENLGGLTIYDRTPASQIISHIGSAEAVITNKTPITRETLDACPRIRYIGVLATGYNVVDTKAAAERGVPVTNIPTYGTAAVAQFVIALLLELCHHIGEHSDLVKKGKWTVNPDFCFWVSPLVELSGKTLGVIGFGRIGQVTARIAEALGMKILAYDICKIPGFEYVELDELLARSDVITLHCPLTPENTGMINTGAIAGMKDGAMLINTSRGPLINEADLAEALRSGKLAGAAVDVVSHEPIRADNPLLSAPNCIITPHIAWAPKESRARLMDIAVSNLKSFLEGGTQNVVNGV
jgi:glycerate dehydrogenase